MGARTVLKWRVPVDDQPHIIGTGEVALVAADTGPTARTDVVQVWTIERGKPARERVVQVFGTGHPVPDDAHFVGSAVASPFVWHVFTVQP